MLITQRLEEADHLSHTEQSIAKYILTNPWVIEKMSTTKLSKKTYTSPSSLVRLAQKLGFKGWNDFKTAYLQEVQYLSTHFQRVDPNIPFTTKDSIMNIASKIALLETESIQDTLSLLHHDDLQLAIKYLLQTDIINIYGLSSIPTLTHDFKHKMGRINRTVNICNENSEFLYQAAFSDAKTCSIIISYSGESTAIVQVAKFLKQTKSPIIVITSIGDNTLKQYAHCILTISTREKLYSKIASYSSGESIHFLLDVLYSCVFASAYQKHWDQKVSMSKKIEKQRRTSISIMKEDGDEKK